QAAAPREIRVGENTQRSEAGCVEAVRGNPAEDAAVLEKAARVGGAAWKARAEITNVGERTAAAVHALREITAPLERGRHARLVHGGRVRAPLVFLAPEEEQLLFSLVETLERDRSAERVAGVVARGLRLGDLRRLALVQIRVGVPRRPPSEPVAGAVEILRAALRDDLHLAADGAPVLRLVRVGQD